MTDADRKELEDHLSKQYLLIPKNRVYHLAGGILVGIAAFVGVTYKAVLQALESEVAGRAKQNIIAIEKSVTEAQQRIAEVEQAGKSVIEKLTATPIDSLQVKEVKIVDKDGKTKLLLATTTTGSGLIWLYDSNDKKRLQVTEINDGSASISLFDRDSNIRMILTTDAAGLPSLRLHDSTKKKRLQLYEDDGGYAGIALIDRNSKARMKLMTEPKSGLPALEMYDDKGAIMPSSPHQ